MIKKPTKREAHGKALSDAFAEHGRALNLHAFFKVSDHVIGQDLVQDTFTKTWSYLVKGGEIETMKAFLYHVLNNLIVDQYRKKKTTSLETLVEKGYEPSTGSSDALFSQLDAKAASLLILKLPIQYQQVMRMKHIQDLSLEEIAKLHGKKKNTIAVQLHRGLEKLRVIYLRTDKQRAQNQNEEPIKKK